jgi:DNA-directed RNA polymerase specialized sigma24 family protein
MEEEAAQDAALEEIEDPWGAYVGRLSPEEFAQFMEEQEALEEAVHPTPRGRDIDDVGRANYARLTLRMGNRNPFCELLLLIHEFRRGNDVFMPLAHAIRWRPGNDPYTRKRFDQWRRELPPVRPGDPTPYLQIVIEALWLMRVPKDGNETPRDLTPQPIRRGRRWVTASRRPLIPCNLHLADYIWWFRNEVTRIIKHEILADVDALSGNDTALESAEGESGEWVVSPVEAARVRSWKIADREGSSPFHEEHVFGGGTKLTRELSQLAYDAETVRVQLSPLQRQILELAAKDQWLRDYREIAERLCRGRDTVKNAVLRVRQKLSKLQISE